MLNYIITNKEWIFSGAGIFLFTIIYNFLLKKQKLKNINHQISGDNSTNIQAGGNIKIENIHHQRVEDKDKDKDKMYQIKIQKETIERQFFEINIKEGDYIDIPWKYKKYRITLKKIIEEDFQLKYFHRANIGVELCVNSGGGLVYGGQYAKSTDVNQYIIPLKNISEEELYSIYSYSVHEGSLSFFRCYISHINSFSREATLNIYIIDVPNTYKEN